MSSASPVARSTADASEPASTAAGWGIDASVTMTWFFPVEVSPFTESLPDALGAQELCAPTLWVLECSKVLQSAHRRRRIGARRRAQIADEWSELPVQLKPAALDFVGLDRLAATHALSACDAAFLEFALRRSVVLVSLDERLLAAARTLGHPVSSAAPSLHNRPN